jgi:UDP-N-acetylglucosamine:LPS N-acetylglucosamine transferase
MKTRILFIISDTGGGHRSAANAIINALVQIDPEITCEMIDLLKASKIPGIRNAPELYAFFSAKSIWLYNILFRLSNFTGFMNFASKFLYQFARAHIHRTINSFGPDLVVVIHPLAVRPICDYRDQTLATWPVVTVVTDLVTIHASWASDRADHYLLPTAAAVTRLTQLGIASDKILLTGFPIHPRFFDAVTDIASARRSLNLPQDQFTILLTSGGAGGGNVESLVTELEKQCPNCTLLVVTGRNEPLFKRLNNRPAASLHTRIYQFVDNMEVLMTACDIVVTKAGPGTIMEAATLGKFIVLTGAVGLQEEGNIEFVVDSHWGVYCPTPLKIGHTVADIAAKAGYSPAHSSTPAPPSAGTRGIAHTLYFMLQQGGH